MIDTPPLSSPPLTSPLPSGHPSLTSPLLLPLLSPPRKTTPPTTGCVPPAPPSLHSHPPLCSALTSQEDDALNHWVCPSCTAQNELRARSCATCSERKPPSAAVATGGGGGGGGGRSKRGGGRDDHHSNSSNNNNNNRQSGRKKSRVTYADEDDEQEEEEDRGGRGGGGRSRGRPVKRSAYDTASSSLGDLGEGEEDDPPRPIDIDDPYRNPYPSSHPINPILTLFLIPSCQPCSRFDGPQANDVTSPIPFSHN